jgi:hypothetical protein
MNCIETTLFEFKMLKASLFRRKYGKGLVAVYPIHESGTDQKYAREVRGITK